MSLNTMTESELGISFEENENQKMIVEMVRDFGDKEIKPNMMKWDESQEFPIQLFKKWDHWD